MHSRSNYSANTHNIAHGTFFNWVFIQSGRDRHITVSRGCHNERNGPMLAHCHGVVAAVPRLAKARELEEHPKR
eukprot:186835-Pelagomonas_calceolata.AAC.3